MGTTQENANVSVYLTTDEAKSKLKELKLLSIDLKEKLDQMGKGSPERKQAQIQLRQIKNEIKGIQNELSKKVELVINGNMAGASIRDLRQASKLLWIELSKLAPETHEFINKSKQLQQVETRLNSLKAQAKGTAGFFSRMKDEVKGFGIMLLGFLGIQALVGQIQNLISKNAQMSDSMADVQKTTGLTKVEVAALNTELGKLNTRSSRQELLKLAADAGKLGITGKENILGFVRAADKINVALGEDLGEDAIKNIGKLNDLFKVKDSHGYEQGMLKIGSSINALGQSSTANEAYLVDFTKRLGGIATQSDISIQNILGLGATLDSLGQQTETSSTAVGMLLVDMFKNTGDYAKIAGMDIKEFSQLLKTDTNEAFIKVLEGLKGNNEGFSVMAQKLKDVGVEGSRGTAVLSTLAGNVTLLRNQQALSNKEFEKGTSILNEFNTKNETFGAGVDKLTKRIYSFFSNSTVTGAMQGLVGFLNGIMDTTPAVDRLTASFNKQKDVVTSYERDLLPLIDRYDELKSKSTLTTSEQDELNSIIGLISKSIPTAITEFDKYGNAMDISSEKARKYGDNLRNLMEVKNAEALVKTRSDLYDLREEIERTMAALNQRNAAGDLVKTIAETKKLAGEFVTTTKEVKLTNQEISLLQEKMQGLQNTRIGLELNINDLSGTEIYKVPDQTQNVNQVVNTAATGPDNTEEQNEKFIKKTQDLTRELQDIRIAAIEDEQQREEAALAAKLERQKQEVTSAEADAKVKKDLLLALDEDYLQKSKALTDKYAQEKNNAAYDRDVSNLNAWNQTQQLLLLEQLNRGELTDKQYKEKLKLQESDFLQERKKLAIEYGQDVVEIEKKIQEDIRTEQENTVATERTKRRAQLEFNVQYARAGTKEELDARVALLTEQLYQEIDQTNYTAEEKKIIWGAYNDTVAQMNRDFLAGQLQEAQTYIDAFMNVFNALTALQSARADKELAKDKSVNDHKKRNLKRLLDSNKISEAKYRAEIEKLDAEHEAKIAKVKRDAFRKDRTAKTIQAIINTAVGVTAAFTMPPPASFILAALTAAAGALEIAAIISAPEPEFEKGRKPTTGIVKGPSHSQQGIKLLDTQTGKIVGEMEGDEGIFSKKMYANNQQIIDAIFDAKGDPITPKQAASATDFTIPDKKQTNPNRVAAAPNENLSVPVFQAGRLISQTLPVEQVSGLKQKGQKLLEATNLIEQQLALRQFKEFSEEVIKIYKEKTEVMNAIENNQSTVTSRVSIDNVSKNQNLEYSMNAVTEAVSSISDRKVLSFQQSEYFKKASYLISQVEDGLLTKETLEINMKILEKRLIDRMVDVKSAPGSGDRDTSGTILNPELDLRSVVSRMAAEPEWINQQVSQLNVERIVENIRMEESIKTLLIVEQLKKEFPSLAGTDKEATTNVPGTPVEDQLTPAVLQLTEVLNSMKTNGVKGVWEHRHFKEGLMQMDEIQSKALF